MEVYQADVCLRLSAFKSSLSLLHHLAALQAWRLQNLSLCSAPRLGGAGIEFMNLFLTFVYVSWLWSPKWIRRNHSGSCKAMTMILLENAWKCRILPENDWTPGFVAWNRVILNDAQTKHPWERESEREGKAERGRRDSQKKQASLWDFQKQEGQGRKDGGDCHTWRQCQCDERKSEKSWWGFEQGRRREKALGRRREERRSVRVDGAKGSVTLENGRIKERPRKGATVSEWLWDTLRTCFEWTSWQCSW